MTKIIIEDSFRHVVSVRNRVRHPQKRERGEAKRSETDIMVFISLVLPSIRSPS
jgi:hypothetical protein